MTKEKLYFAGYYLVFPLLFLVSSVLWRLLTRGNGLPEVLFAT